MCQIYKGWWYNSCCVLHTKLTNRALYPVVMYVVANPVHGLLDDRTRSEEHLQSYNESIKTKIKQNKGTYVQKPNETKIIFSNSYPHKKPMYVPLPIPCLSLTHDVINVR